LVFIKFFSFASTGDAFNITANTNGIAATIINNSTTANTFISVNAQILPEGFGSYLDGILPSDIATSAGAFSATMQQVKNIRKIEIEKLAQVVANLETIEGLPLVNGTNIPANAVEAQAALSLVALGTGPKGTYTFSDLFGCMSGLPYGWVNLQSAITSMPTGNLSTIYSNLYTATQGPSLGLDAAVQAQIDLANAAVYYFTSSATGNWTTNFRMIPGTFLNSEMGNNESISAVVMSTQGSSPFFSNIIQVDGVTVTPKWQDALPPSSGNASSVDIYNFNIIKTTIN
jgi:hypothetical protein